MIRSISYWTAVGLLCCTAAALADTPAAPAAPAVPAPAAAAAPAAAQRVFGRASAVDLTGKKVTVAGFGQDAADQTFTYNDDTKFMEDVTAQQSEIKVGDTLRLFGQPSDDGKSIAPMFMSIVPDSDLKDPPFTGPFQPTSGVVATITPSLTITTADNKTITVDTSGTPRIIKSVDGKADLLKNDAFINALVTGPSTALVATKVHVFQAPAGGGN